MEDSIAQVIIPSQSRDRPSCRCYLIYSDSHLKIQGSLMRHVFYDHALQVIGEKSSRSKKLEVTGISHFDRQLPLSASLLASCASPL